MIKEGKLFTKKPGEPVDGDQVSLSDAEGNILLRDTVLVDKLANFNRERIPERVVHAKGWGAHGEFVLTRDMSKYTLADLFTKVGKKVRVLVRFSTVAGGRESADTVRDPRGFAVKFYTDEGIHDIVMNNTPVFFIRDPMKFPDFIHSQKKNPVTNLTDPNAQWDFLTLTPESLNQVTVLFSDQGIPYGFRYMDGFGTDTFSWYNARGEYVYIKYHFISEQGIKNLPVDEAQRLAGENPDFAGEDLRNAIDRGEYPSWRVKVQIMTPEEAKKYRFDPFDTTKTWYEEDFPLIEIGRLTLNKNPENFFNEVEQAAFCPGNMVPGTSASPDKMLQGRMVFYTDTQRYRIGVNFNRVPVNASDSPVFNYQRDGALALNPTGKINYYPNSYDDVRFSRRVINVPPGVTAPVKREAPPIKDADFIQPRDRFLAFDEGERRRLMDNIAASLGQAAKKIQYRAAALFYKTAPAYGEGVAERLKLNLREVRRLSKLSQKELEYATR